MQDNHLGGAGAGGETRRPVAASFCDPLRLLDNGRHSVPLRPESERPAVSGRDRFALAPRREDAVARRVSGMLGCGRGPARGGCA